jgi:hypothetical protein
MPLGIVSYPRLLVSLLWHLPRNILARSSILRLTQNRVLSILLSRSYFQIIGTNLFHLRNSLAAILIHSFLQGFFDREGTRGIPPQSQPSLHSQSTWVSFTVIPGRALTAAVSTQAVLQHHGFSYSKHIKSGSQMLWLILPKRV